MLRVFGYLSSLQNQRQTSNVVCDCSENERVILWFHSRNPGYFSSVSERPIISS